MPRKGSEIVDVDVVLHHQTAGAYKVSLDGKDANAVWVPAAPCEIEKVPGKRLWQLTLPADLAEEKGLV